MTPRRSLPAAVASSAWVCAVVLLLVAVASPALGGSVLLQSGSTSGTFQTSDASATFDLHGLRSTKQYVAATDSSAAASKQYSYIFNIGGNVTSPDVTKCGAAPGPAFQVKYGVSSGKVVITACQRIANNPSDAELTQLDDNDASKGLTIKYLNGAMCSGGIPRTFSVNLICADTLKGGDPADPCSQKNEIDAPVDEGDSTQKCHYEVEFVTRLACPLQCPISQRGLMCNGGFCGFDTSTSAPRCFCQRGYFGTDCSLTSLPAGTCTGMCILLICTIILLAILLVSGALVYWYVHSIVKKQQQMGLSQSGGGAKGGRGGSDSVKLQLQPDSEGDELGLPGSTVAMQRMPGGHARVARDEHLENIDLDVEDDEDASDL